MSESSHHSLILFGHGSRDPLWRQPIEAVAARMQRLQPEVPVRCAYLELSAPNLPECASELIAIGARSVGIVPMFLGNGRHTREDLPVLVQALRAQHPTVQFKVQVAMGEHPAVLDLMAEIALGAA